MNYADDIEENIDETLEDIEESGRGNEGTARTLAESIRRIEHANMYLALIQSDVFQPGSGRPDIVSVVNADIKKFATDKINELLGMTQPEPAKTQVITESQFSDDELLALRMLAAKVLKKDVTSLATEIKKPVMNTVAAPASNIPTPALKTVAAPKPVAQPAKTAAQQSAPAETKTPKKRVNKKAVTSADKSYIAPGTKTATGQTRTAGGYAVPPNYTPPLLQNQPTISQQTPPITTQGLNVQNLVNQITGGSNTIATLSDETGGDPNERI